MAASQSPPIGTEPRQPEDGWMPTSMYLKLTCLALPNVDKLNVELSNPEVLEERGKEAPQQMAAMVYDRVRGKQSMVSRTVSQAQGLGNDFASHNALLYDK